MDRKATKKMSNEEWVNPADPDAEITRLKDGRTALAYKTENAVDMATGAIVAVTTHGGATGDTESIQQTLPAAGEAVAEQIAERTAQGYYYVNARGVQEMVGNKDTTVVKWFDNWRKRADLHCRAGSRGAPVGWTAAGKVGRARQPAAG